ncbi:MAG: hypothetical protein WBM90_09515 [Acidimicrobiia bacterium]
MASATGLDPVGFKVFVHYFTHVSLGMSEVEHRLDAVRNNLTDMADVAYREGEQLRARVGPWDEGFAKEVKLDLGMAEIHASGLVYPMTWSAAGAGILFPELKADLTLAHVSQDTTRLTVQGTYQPPLGVVGKMADRALLGRYADATVRNWLDQLAQALVEGEFNRSAS